jgi:5-methylcytosine-specific restriction protein A
MPWAPGHGCAEPRCPAIVPRGQAYCPTHTAKKNAERAADPVRAASQRLYNNSRWRSFRLLWLQAHPLCEGECKAAGRVIAGSHVDHVTPHGGDPMKFWKPDGGFRTLCASCHSKKTNRADGGFGNPIR